MPEIVSIMVTPTGSNDALPQVLLEQSGAWRDMSPPLDVRMLVSVPDLRQRMDGLLMDLMGQMRISQTPSWAALKAAFKRHYQDIVPSGVRQVLQDVAARAGSEPPLLRIHTFSAAEWIPWELLHDGTDFLGLRFQIVRLPVTSKGPDLSLPGPHPIRQVYSFLGKNVFLPALSAQLNQEWQATFDGLLPAVVQQRRYPDQPAALANDYPNVDHLLAAAATGDILHITCHGGLKDKNGQYHWTLNHESTLTFSYHINSTLLSDFNPQASPLVFGNACISSQPGDGDGLASGFGTQFFAQGALAFIGTFAPITQPMAVHFARQFYTLLLGGNGQPNLPVGKALLLTKRCFASQNEMDPSYLYYCMYGPAETVFQAI
jgi:hypothetical protein